MADLEINEHQVQVLEKASHFIQEGFVPEFAAKIGAFLDTE